MDEKWDAFTEDNVVFLHHSWTGFEIFEAAFVPAEGGGWMIVGAMIESDPERYGGTPDMRAPLTLELVLSATCWVRTLPSYELGWWNWPPRRPQAPM